MPEYEVEYEKLKSSDTNVTIIKEKSAQESCFDFFLSLYSSHYVSLPPKGYNSVSCEIVL